MSAAFNRLYLEAQVASKPRFTRHGVTCNIAIPQRNGPLERLHAVSARPEVSTVFGKVQLGATVFLCGELRTKPLRMAVHEAVIVRLPEAGAKRGPLVEEQSVKGYSRMLASGRVIRVEAYKRGGKRPTKQ